MSSAGDTFVNWAQYGVDIFFVISGFTIFYQFYEKGYQLKYFLMQRVLRISAPYWPLLLLLFFMGLINVPIGSNPWAQGVDTSGLNWFLHATYLNFWSVEYSNTIIGIEWTLGIEVFYYVFLGIILNSLLFKRSKLMFSLLLGMFLYVVSLIGGDLINMNRVPNYLDIHWSPMLYGYMFMLGGAAYFCRKEFEKILSNQKKVMNQLSNTLFFLVGVLFLLNIYFHYFTQIPLMFALFTFVLLVFVRDESMAGWLLTNRVIILFGSISYSFYLWHFIVLHTEYINISYLAEMQTVDFFYKFLITIMIASVWHYIFEQKAYVNLKRRLKRND